MVVAWLLSALPVVITFLQRIDVPQLSFGLIGGPVVAAAEEMGLHGTIGALLFGAALSGLSQGVRDDIMPGMRSASEGLFVPLFFASAGLHFDLSFTSLPATTTTALVLVPLAGKFAGAFIGTYVSRIDAPFALATGLMSKGVAEIAFLLVLLEGGAIQKDVFSLLVLIMFGYILFMPAVINFAVARTTLCERPALPDSVAPSFARYALQEVQVRSVFDKTREYPGSDTSVAEFMESWTVSHQHEYLVSTAARSRSSRPPGSSTGRRAARQHADHIPRRADPRRWPTPPRGDRGGTGSVLGLAHQPDVIDLVVLMNEIDAELKQMGSVVAEGPHEILAAARPSSDGQRRLAAGRRPVADDLAAAELARRDISTR